MNIPTLAATTEVQRARGILAELSERGDELLTREAHLDVLLAFDHLERAGLDAWPPPPAATGIVDPRTALAAAHFALVAILGDVTRHRVLSMPVGFAANYVGDALGTLP
jgi:hypothetical protein